VQVVALRRFTAPRPHLLPEEELQFLSEPALLVVGELLVREQELRALSVTTATSLPTS